MDAILSVRISDELKQKFNELAQSEGINNKELMEQVVKYYELNRAREEDSTMSEDIKELQTITSRMADIYINIVERNNVKSLEVKNLHKNELVDKNTEIQKLKEEIDLIKEENKKIISLGKELSNVKNEHKELEGNIKSLKTFNNMQNEKIINLTQVNENYIKYKDEIVKLKTDHDLLANENRQLKTELLNTKDKKESLIKQIGELVQINKDKIETLEIKSIQDIELQKERTGFEVGKEVLRLREQQQTKIQQLHESFNDRINKLLREKEEAAEKFKNMIFEMDRKNIKAEDTVIEKN